MSPNNTKPDALRLRPQGFLHEEKTMRRVEVWQVTIEAQTGPEWGGTFVNPPTPTDLCAAIITDMNEHREAMEDDSCDESDLDVLGMELERLTVIHQIADHIDENFTQVHGWQRIRVADIQIGRLRVTTDRAFLSGEWPKWGPKTT
jgi:hypothetical protein